MEYYDSSNAGLTVFIIIVALGLLVLGTIFLAEAAEKKGYADEKGKIIAICILCGMPGWLYVVALPDKNAAKQREQLIKALHSLNKGQNFDTCSISDELPEI